MQDVSHSGCMEGVEVSQVWNKTGGEQRLFGGGVRIAVLIAGEKIGPQTQAIFYFKNAEGYR